MMIKTLIAAALVAGAMPSVDAGLQWMKANQYTDGRGGESGLLPLLRVYKRPR